MSWFPTVQLKYNPQMKSSFILLCLFLLASLTRADESAAVPDAARGSQERLQAAIIEFANGRIAARLKMPASARFFEQATTKPMEGWDYYEVRGRHSAKNSFGNEVHGTHRVIVKHLTGDSRLELTYLNIDGKSIYGKWDN